MKLSVAAFCVALAMLSSAPSAAQVKPTMTADQRRSELAIVRAEYVDKGPEFDRLARHRAHDVIEHLSRQAKRLTDVQYLLGLAEIAAQANNGHDSLSVANSPLLPAFRLPIRMVWIGNRLFVARAATDYCQLVGAEVLTLGHLTPSELFSRLRRHQGGKDVYRRWNLSWMFHNPALLMALGATDTPSAASIRVRSPTGKSINQNLHAVSVSDMPKQPFPVGWWSAVLSPDEVAKGWCAAGRADAVPLYLQQPDRYFRMAELPHLHALYVQFRSNFDMGNEKIAPFVGAVEQRLASSPPENLVLDLRFDTGGDNTQNRELMSDIARQVRGRIFVLTGPYTFSAGIASEAAVIHDGGAKVVIVGDEPGDRTEWWSEHEPLCLPYSKACVDREVGHWNLVAGCAGQSHCFGDKFDVRIKTLAPRIRRSMSANDWLAGRDAVVDAIRKTYFAAANGRQQ